MEITKSRRPVVMVGPWPRGRDPLREFTRERIGERLALMVDDRVLVTPAIHAPLTDLLRIDRGWEMSQTTAALELAAILKAGVLPAPVVAAEAPQAVLARAP